MILKSIQKFNFRYSHLYLTSSIFPFSFHTSIFTKDNAHHSNCFLFLQGNQRPTMFGLFRPKVISRRERSENILKKIGIKLNRSLPPLEMEENIQLRPATEIAERLVVLTAVNYVACDATTPKEILNALKSFQLSDHLSPKEVDFLKNPTPENKIQESWKCEAIWTLLWALNIVEDLGSPKEICNLSAIPPQLFPFGQGGDSRNFIQMPFIVRSKAEILDAQDLYYRMYWACTDAIQAQREFYKVDPNVVYERLYALHWLTTHLNEEWDEITFTY